MLTRSRKRKNSEIKRNRGPLKRNRGIKEKICGNQPNKPDRLHIDGYKIIKKAVDIPDNVYEELKKQVDKKARFIFNSSRNDKKRVQCRLSYRQKYMSAFVLKLNRYIKKNVSNNLSINDWVILKSKPGCKEQLSHCDYLPSDDFMECPEDYIPLLCLVAIEPNTKINVWKNSIGYSSLIKINKTILSLDKGDMFIFRGDLVHAGASYDKENIRLHAYLDSFLCPREPNRTYIISKHAPNEFSMYIEE